MLSAGDWIRIDGHDVCVETLKDLKDDVGSACVKLKDRGFPYNNDRDIEPTMIEKVKRDIEPAMQRDGRRTLDRNVRVKLRQGDMSEWTSATFFAFFCGCSHNMLPPPMSVAKYKAVVAAGTPVSETEEQAYRINQKRSIQNQDIAHSSGTTMSEDRFIEVMEEARACIRALVCDDIVYRDELLAQQKVLVVGDDTLIQTSAGEELFVHFQRVYVNVLPLAEAHAAKKRWIDRYPQQNLDGSFKYEWSQQMGTVFVDGSPFEVESQLPGTFTTVAVPTFDGYSVKLDVSADLTSMLSAGDWIRIDGHDVCVAKLTSHKARGAYNASYKKRVTLKGRGFPGAVSMFAAEKVKRDIEPAMGSNGRPIDQYLRQKLRQGDMSEWDSTTFFTFFCGCSHNLLPSPTSFRQRNKLLSEKEEQAYRINPKRSIRNRDIAHSSGTTMSEDRFIEVMEEARACIRALVCDDIVYRDELLGQQEAIEDEANKELEQAKDQSNDATGPENDLVLARGAHATTMALLDRGKTRSAETGDMAGGGVVERPKAGRSLTGR
jgi:hypothetical protein